MSRVKAAAGLESPRSLTSSAKILAQALSRAGYGQPTFGLAGSMATAVELL